MSEPDGNEMGEGGQGGKRISRMFSNNAVVKFFAGTKSIERMILNILTRVLPMLVSNHYFSGL